MIPSARYRDLQRCVDNFHRLTIDSVGEKMPGIPKETVEHRFICSLYYTFDRLFRYIYNSDFNTGSQEAVGDKDKTHTRLMKKICDPEGCEERMDELAHENISIYDLSIPVERELFLESSYLADLSGMIDSYETTLSIDRIEHLLTSIKHIRDVHSISLESDIESIQSAFEADIMKIAGVSPEHVTEYDEDPCIEDNVDELIDVCVNMVETLSEVLLEIAQQDNITRQRFFTDMETDSFYMRDMRMLSYVAVMYVE